MLASRLLLLVSLTLAVIAPSANAAHQPAAKPPAKEYRILPFDGDMAALLKNQLLESLDKEQFHDLMKEFQRNPKAYQRPEKASDLLKGTGFDDPELVKRVTEIFKSKKDKSEQIQEVQKELARAKEEKISKQKSLTSNENSSREQGSFNLPPGGQSPAFDKLVKETMGLLENKRFSKLRSEMKQSAAFDLAKSRLAGNPGEVIKNWPALDWLKLPESAPAHFPGAIPSIDSYFGAPSISLRGTKQTGESLLMFFALTAFAAAAIYLVWKLLGRFVETGPRKVAFAPLGPWPCPPNQVATRAQLIAAFEYLALLILGTQARTANHRNIAAKLGETPERRRAADELARLYEKARYAPAAGELQPPVVAAARRDLCLLAGMTEFAPGAR
jgi:hypothetical protein